MKSRSLRLIALAGSLTLGVPTSAQPQAPQAEKQKHAQPSPSRRAEAKTHFDSGFRLAQEGKYQDALKEFIEAYNLVPSFNVRYNIAQAYEELKRPADAVEHFERYLAEGGKAISEEEQQEVLERIAKMGAQAQLTGLVTLRVVPNDATVSLDGKPLAKSTMGRAQRIALGQHEIEVAKSNYGTERRTITVSSIRDADYEVVLAREVGSAKPPDDAPKVQISPIPTEPRAAGPQTTVGDSRQRGPSIAGHQDGSGQRLASYLTFLAGVASVGVGTFFYREAVDAHDKAVAYCPNGACEEPAYSFQEDAKGYLTVSNVTLIAGAVAMAGGALLFFTAPTGTAKTASSRLRFDGKSTGPVTVGVSW